MLLNLLFTFFPCPGILLLGLFLLPSGYFLSKLIIFRYLYFFTFLFSFQFQTVLAT